MKKTISFILIATLIACSDFSSGFSSSEYPDSYRKGMNVFFMPPRNRFHESDFTESLLRLRSDGINALYLVPYYFSKDEFSDGIDSTERTLPDDSLVRAILLSRQYGFSVALKPHIDLLNNVPRYKIAPRDYSVWIANYKTFINRYLAISLQCGLHDFVIGTELDNAVEKKEFHDFCDSVRQACPMKLMYAASHDHFASTGMWDHVDIMGVNAYFNLDNNLPPSPDVLRETWNYWLQLISGFSALKGKPMILTEVGYSSRSTAAQNPGSWSGDPPPDMEVQKACYEALLSQAGGFDGIRGIYWWQWELGKIGGGANNDFTPRDKPAEDVIRSYWAR